MITRSVPVDEKWQASLGLSEAEAQKTLRLILAVKLYDTLGVIA
jgi:hypothetical protein